MSKYTDVNPKLCEQSAIAIKKACYMAIARKLSLLIKDSDDLLRLRDFKYHTLFNDLGLAEAYRQMLCEKYLPYTKIGICELAELLGISRQRVNNWSRGKTLIPAEMAKVLHEKLAISLYELRPDLYEEKV
jgi:transcriptional regulator with XRE-family HTH domain